MEAVLDLDAQCWLDQCRRALTESSRFKACFNSRDSWEWYQRNTVHLWHVGFGLFPPRHTRQLLRRLYCISVCFHAPISEEVSLVIHVMPGVGIDHCTTPSAASSSDFFSVLQAECRATVLSRQVETDYLNVSSPISAACTEQLRSLLHLCRRLEGSLPEYCADHPGEYSLSNLKSSRKK